MICLNDDELSSIFRHLAKIAPGRGSDFQRERIVSCRHVLRFSASSKTARSAFAADVQLIHEVKLRKQNDTILPSFSQQHSQQHEFPYSHQNLQELFTKVQIKALKKCEYCLVLNSKLGRRRITAAKKDIMKATNHRLLNLQEEGSNILVAVAAEGGVFYSIARSKTSLDGREVLCARRVSSTGELLCETVLDDKRRPVYLACSQRGDACAFIDERSTDQDPDLMDLSRIFVVSKGRIILIDSSESRAQDGVLDLPGVSNPQAIWFKSDGSICVAWSTGFVEPHGIDVQNGSEVTQDERYTISSHKIIDDESVQFITCFGPFNGRLVSVSADRTGDRVVALIQQQQIWVNDSKFRAHLHLSETCARLQHSGLSKDLCAASISPSGNVVVCLARSENLNLLVEVLDLDVDSAYRPIIAKTVPQLSGPFADQSSDEEDEEDEGEGAVEAGPSQTAFVFGTEFLPFSLSFTSCNSFVMISDNRSLFGARPTKFAIVLVDLRSRRSSILKLLPFFHASFRSFPKELFWRNDGVWIHKSNGEILRLHRPPL